MFSNLKISKSKSEIALPHKDESEDTFIWCNNSVTLEDGTIIKLSLWEWEGTSIWDVSVSEEDFDPAVKGSFDDYMRMMGLELDNVIESSFGRWKYMGMMEHKGEYRLQFVELG